MQQSSATQSLHLSFWGLRKIVACSHSSSQCLLVSTVFGTVSSLHPTSFLMILHLFHTLNRAKNCRYKKPLQDMVESMQQSSATPKNQDVGRGLRKIVACSQPYLTVASCIYSFWHGVIPTSYFIFNDFYTCNIIMFWS